MNPVSTYVNGENLAYLTVASIAITAVVLGVLNFASLCNFVPPYGSYALVFGGLGLNAVLIFSNCKKKNVEIENHKSKTKSPSCYVPREITISSQKIPVHIRDTDSYFSVFDNAEAFMKKFNEQLKEKVGKDEKNFTCKYSTLIVVSLKGDNVEKDNEALSSTLIKYFATPPQYGMEKNNTEKTALILIAPYTKRDTEVFNQLRTVDVKTGQETHFGTFKRLGGISLNFAFGHRAIKEILDEILIEPAVDTHHKN